MVYILCIYDVPKFYLFFLVFFFGYAFLQIITNLKKFKYIY